MEEIELDEIAEQHMYIPNADTGLQDEAMTQHAKSNQKK